MGILTDHTIGLEGLRLVWKSKDKYTKFVFGFPDVFNNTTKNRSYEVNVNHLRQTHTVVII